MADLLRLHDRGWGFHWEVFSGRALPETPQKEALLHRTWGSTLTNVLHSQVNEGDGVPEESMVGLESKGTMRCFL